MPKLKTNRSAAKRFHRTATGKLRREKAFASHILTKKSRKRKRNLRQLTVVSDANMKLMRKLLPFA